MTAAQTHWIARREGDPYHVVRRNGEYVGEIFVAGPGRVLPSAIVQDDDTGTREMVALDECDSLDAALDAVMEAAS